jgi:16S rRNA (guanine527-N7)-methyltransferase
MELPLETLLREGAGEYGVNMDGRMTLAFMLYKSLLLEWNEKINLTAIEEDRDVIVKHFVDSLSIVPFLKDVHNIVDVGTGAGFPGIPLKIVLPSLEVVLLDSLDKRVGFLNTVISSLQLRGISAVHSRAEDAGSSPKYRGKFDAAVARAVAFLPVLLEYCLPMVRTDGIFIAMKGSNSEEIAASGKALDILGAKIEVVKEFTLPHTDMKRNIIIIRKLRQTPTKYPRKSGKPSKEPLV